MPIIEACYLYPVKGMTPQEVSVLDLQPGSSPVGDRAFAFAFADAELKGKRGWVHKFEAVTLLGAPHLARLQSSYDPETRRLTITSAEDGTADASVDDPDERQRLAEWLAGVVKRFPKDPFRGEVRHEPLQLLGDGRTLFTDRGPTQVSLASLESLRDLSERAGTDVDVRRFRANLAFSGSAAWEEFGWDGRRLRVGEVVMEVTAPLKRCKAINASPTGAGRDINLLDVLDDAYGHLNFGVEANVVSGGRVSPGDGIELMS